MFRLSAAVFCALFLALAAMPSKALAGVSSPGDLAAPRTDTPSGLPVPRFVSFKNARTHCRAGPSFAHAVSATYIKAGLPVEVVAETTDHWRKIRDSKGYECWAHQTTLRAVSHVLVLSETSLRARPEAAAAPRAKLESGVLAKIDKTGDSWLLLSVSGLKGWAPRAALWGAPD